MVEDDPKDVELTLTALEEYNLANEIIIVGDGDEALDYLYKRGALRANNDETLTAAIITEQGGKENHREREQDCCSFPSQFRPGGTGQAGAAQVQRGR